MQDFEDVDGADAPEDNAEYSQEFARLAREEKDRPGQGGSDQDRHEPEPKGSEAGQAEQAPHGSDAASPPSAEQAPDIWSTADPKLREAFEAEKQARERAENAVRTNSGRLSQAHQELNTLRAKVAEVSGAPAAGNDAGDEESLKRLQEDFPEVAKPILAELERLKGTINELTQQQQGRSEQEQEQYLLGQQQELEKVHPNWLERSSTQEFAAWFWRQPRYIQDGIRRNGDGIVDAAEAIDLFNRFETETTGSSGQQDQTAAKRARQLEAGRSVPAKSPPATGSTPDDYHSEWERLKQQEKRQATR